MGAMSRISMVTRVVAAVLAAYLVVSALGSLFSADGADDSGGLVWAGLVLVAAAAIIAGLVMVRRRPVPGTVILCLGAVLAGVAFFWFPPFWMVSLLIVVGAVWSLRTSNAKATAVAG